MSIKTLFIDDERWGVIPYFKELEKRGFECFLAKDGDQAIEQLSRQKFDLISMDIMFPPGNKLGDDVKLIDAGVKLLTMIRRGKVANCPSNIKVIVLTAVIDYEKEKQMREMGVVKYIKKPIEYSKVIEEFQNLDEKDEQNSIA